MIGQHVALDGWIYSCRVLGSGTLVFIDLGDGSTVTPLRCIAKEDKYQIATSDRVLDFVEVKKLSLGCSIHIDGLVEQAPGKATQTFEINIQTVTLYKDVEDPVSYPIQKSILKTPVSLRKQLHARFRAPLVQQLMKIRSEALFAVHEFFHKEQVPLIDPNIMTSSDCEGAGEIFEVSPQFFSTASKVGLTVSSQLPLEAIAMGTGSVYTCQKSFRAEESDTCKHLAEFLHVEFERYFITLDQLLEFTERFVKYLIQTVLERCQEQYEFFQDPKKSPSFLAGQYEFLKTALGKPFIKITHRDAVDMMQQDLKDKKTKMKVYPKQGQDLCSEHEKYLVEKFGGFVFVTHWPSDIKSFYMKQCDDGTCESFDLLAPSVGELFGGSMREWRYDVLQGVMEKRKMSDESLQWFVDLRKDGSAPHGGWGMGFDRLVMFLTGVQSVRDVVPYPVYYGHCPY